MCCGGEDLRQLIASGKLEKVGGLLQEVKENAIAVAANKAERIQALKQKSQRSSSGSRISSTIGAHAVGSVGSAAIGAGFNTIVVRQRKSGQSTGPFSSLTPPPPSPPAVSPLPRGGLNPSHDSSTLGRESRRKADRSSVGSRRVPSSSAPSSVERVSVCSLSSCSKKEKSHPLVDNETSIHSKRRDLIEDDNLKMNGTLERSGSELSISSLPSTTSPVEVYIARGALTDESEYESDADNKQQLQQTANLNNLEKSSQHANSHVGSHLSSKHSAINSYYGSNIYQPHHRSAIRNMFACLVGRPHQHPATFSTTSKENFSQRASNYYYDAGLDTCVGRRKKTKKSKKKSNKKKKSCRGQNNYCYYCTSHNYPSSASQAPSRTSNQSTTTTLQTGGGSRHSQHPSAILNNNSNNENASLLSRNLPSQTVDRSVKSGHHLNVKNSCGLSPSPEPDSQQALLSNYSDRSSCHSGHSTHHSINSSNYKDYITNYCSKTSSYNHDCHPECSRKNSSQTNNEAQSMDLVKPEITSLSSAGRVRSTSARSHTSSPMRMSCSPPQTTNHHQNVSANLSNAIVVTAETHLQETDLDKVSRCSSLKQLQQPAKSDLSLSEPGEIVNTKDDPQPLVIEQQIVPQTSSGVVQPPTKMDFVEQLHQFQQNYLKQHPEVNSLTSTDAEQLHVQVATECNNDPNNNQQQQQQQQTDTNSTQPIVTGSVGSDDADF